MGRILAAALVAACVGTCDAADVLRRRIDAALGDKKLGATRVGARVIAADSGKVLYSLRASEQFIPASNVKIITSAAALAYLGEDFRFRTRICARGRVRAGKIAGDLIVWGSGDPNISGRLYDDDPLALPNRWAKALVGKGIRQIQGDLILDDLAFDGEGRHPSWDKRQHHRWYQAPAGAISFNDNCIDVHVRPGAGSGGRAIVTISPATAFVTLENRISTVAKGAALVNLSREIDGTHIVATGKVPVSAGAATYWVTVDDPALFFGTVFAEALARQGIRLEGGIRKAQSPTGADGRSADVLIEHTSRLGDTIAVMNRRSQNFYAENVLKCLGWKRHGRGTFTNGTRAMSDFLSSLGYAKDSCVLADGSGLSKTARVSPAVLTDVLVAMNQSKHRDVYVASLARPGEPGTLRKRMRTGAVRDAVFAKTGYVRGVSALSGYVRTRSGGVLAFSVLMNELACPLATARSAQDALCQILAEQ